MQNNIVSVLLNAEEVGKLYWDERNHRAIFNCLLPSKGSNTSILPEEKANWQVKSLLTAEQRWTSTRSRHSFTHICVH